jgi:hypothetical protein
MILYVGDDPDFVQECEQRFNDWRIAVAGRKIEAQADLPPETIVVLDLSESDVLQQIEACRTTWPMLPLIVVSALRPNTLTAMGLARLHGADAFFLKPIEDWQPFAAAIGNARQRLDRWAKQMQHFQGN